MQNYDKFRNPINYAKVFYKANIKYYRYARTTGLDIKNRTFVGNVIDMLSQLRKHCCVRVPSLARTEFLRVLSEEI